MKIGNFIKQTQGFNAFIPNKFPPIGGFSFSDKINNKSHQASILVGKLDGVTEQLPNIDFFLLMYLRKDAAASSKIEGTQATMIDAIKADINVDKNSISDDVGDILHYINALKHGIKRTKNDEFPLSLRLLKELHKILMENGARVSQYADPGEFRRSQNWIGGRKPDDAKFVPPPVKDMEVALDDLEKFIHSKDDIPLIIKAGIIHAQFEVIHPFLDGNGRTGRMLVVLYLLTNKSLEYPLLYLSSYFSKYKQVYYEKLQDYGNGKIEEWLDFFLDGVMDIANEAMSIVRKITSLYNSDMVKLHSLGKRSAESTIIILQKLYETPIVSATLVALYLKITKQGAYKIIEKLKELNILVPYDDKEKYGQLFVYKEYLDLFKEDI